MAGVTDLPFRLLCKEQGAGLLCMEMVSAKAILYKNKNTQELLEIEDIKEQCEQLITLIMNEAQIAAIRTQLAVNVKEKIDKNQKEYILREQLEYIKEELGDKVQYSDTQDLEEKLEKLKASDEVKEKIKKEINHVLHFYLPVHRVLVRHFWQKK